MMPAASSIHADSAKIDSILGKQVPGLLKQPIGRNNAKGIGGLWRRIWQRAGRPFSVFDCPTLSAVMAT
jgi:hypothetical protein